MPNLVGSYTANTVNAHGIVYHSNKPFCAARLNTSWTQWAHQGSSGRP